MLQHEMFVQQFEVSCWASLIASFIWHFLLPRRTKMSSSLRSRTLFTYCTTVHPRATSCIRVSYTPCKSRNACSYTTWWERRENDNDQGASSDLIITTTWWCSYPERARKQQQQRRVDDELERRISPAVLRVQQISSRKQFKKEFFKILQFFQIDLRIKSCKTNRTIFCVESISAT